MTIANQVSGPDRQEQIQKELAVFGLRMEPSLSALDGEGHAVVRISDNESVDPLEFPPEVLNLAEEWSVLEGVTDSEESPGGPRP